MSILLEGTDETKIENANEIIDQLTSANWYHQAGVKEEETVKQLEELLNLLNVKEYEVKWVTKDKVPSLIENLSFEDSNLWEVLKELPDQLKEKIDAQNLEEHLERLVDRLPEAIFHPAYDGAYKQFEDEKSIKFLTTLAMYLGLMVSTAELAGEEKLLKPILTIIESGHAPIGIDGNLIYVI
ncbi:hypothetical protein [Virgibacillus ainsalahensis]